MGSTSIWHWAIILVIGTYIVPVWRVVTKAGYSGWWSIVCFVPLLNILLLWVFAFSTWPVTRKQAARQYPIA